MKSFDYNAAYVTEVPLLACNEHFPVTITTKGKSGAETIGIEDDRVTPLFADSEVDSYPTCDVCGKVHDYVNLTIEGLYYEIGQLDERIADTAGPLATQFLYEERDKLVEQLVSRGEERI